MTLIFSCTSQEKQGVPLQGVFQVSTEYQVYINQLYYNECTFLWYFLQQDMTFRRIFVIFYTSLQTFQSNFSCRYNHRVITMIEEYRAQKYHMHVCNCTSISSDYFMLYCIHFVIECVFCCLVSQTVFDCSCILVSACIYF